MPNLKYLPQRITKWNLYGYKKKKKLSDSQHSEIVKKKKQKTVISDISCDIYKKKPHVSKAVYGKQEYNNK